MTRKQYGMVALFCSLGFSPLTLLAEDEKRTPITVADVKHEGDVDFQKDILPVLRRKCLACHNATDAESDLVLETPATILKGGIEGPSVVAGKGGESLLLKLAAHQKDPVMPPSDNDVGAKNLTSQELGLLKLWIDQGAKGTVTSDSTTVEWQPLPSDVNPIYAVSVTADGQFAAASRANQVFVYHVPSKRVLGRLTDPQLLKSGFYDKPGVAHLDLVHSLRFNPQGDLLASGGYRNVKLWRRVQDEKLADIAGIASARSLAVSADRKWLAVGQEDGKIQLVDLASNKVAKTLAGHGGAVRGVAFTADGLLVSGSQDKSVRFWQVDEAKESRPAIETAAEVFAVAVVGQGKLVAAAGSDNVIRTFTLAAPEGDTPVEPVKEFKGHGGAITALATIGNGDQFVSSSQDATVRIWNAAGGNMLRQISHGGPVAGIAVSPDGKVLASVGANKSGKLWNAANGQMIAEMKGEHRSALKANRYTRSVALGKKMVDLVKKDLDEAQKRKKSEEDNAKKAEETVKKAEAEFKTKDEASKKPIADKEAADKALTEAQAKRTEAEENKKKAEEAQKAADAKLKESQAALAKADEGKKADAEKAVKDATEAKKQADQTRKTADQEFSKADGAFKQAENKVKQTSTPAQKATDERNAAERALQAAKRSVERAKKSVEKATQRIPVVEAIVKAAEEKHKQLTTELEAAKKEATESAKELAAVAFSPDGTIVAIGGAGQAVQTFAANNGSAIDTIRGQAENIRLLAFAADAAVVSLGEANSAVVWNSAVTWKLERQIGAVDQPEVLVDRVTALDFNSDGTQLATGSGEPSRSGQIKVWQVADGALVKEIKEPHSDTVLGLEFSPDDKQIASCAADRFMKLFNLADGKFVRSFEGHTHHVLGVSWSATGRTLATSGADKVIKVWDARTGDQKKTITGFSKEVTGVRFLVDRDEMVASCGDKNVYMKRADGGNVRSFAGGKDYMYSVAISEEGNLVVSGGQDSVVRIWSSDGKVQASFEPPAPAEPADDKTASK